MATYVSLLRYTDQGIRTIKESPARLDAAKKAFQSMGAELKQFFRDGEYDHPRDGGCLPRPSPVRPLGRVGGTSGQSFGHSRKVSTGRSSTGCPDRIRAGTP
jgi:hypothetical protein